MKALAVLAIVLLASSFRSAIGGESTGDPVSFRRGDVNADGKVDVSDPVWLVNALFLSGPVAPCKEAADADDDGNLTISDVGFLIEYYFLHGPVPAQPFPACGADPTPDSLGCASFPPCL